MVPTVWIFGFAKLEKPSTMRPGHVMAGSGVAGWIVWVALLGGKNWMAAPGPHAAPFARLMASRSEPDPLSAVLVTLNAGMTVSVDDAGVTFEPVEAVKG